MITLTPEQNATLNAEIANDPTGKGYAAFLPDQPGHAVDLMMAKTEFLPRERIITSRGIASILGVVDGEAFLKALEDFSVSTLKNDHPLYTYQAGIKRQIAWLSTSGLDLGDKETRTMLDVLVLVGVIPALWATRLKDAALKPASRCEVLGLPAITNEMFANRNK